jgi:chromatin assembly factor 1 subunit A
VKCIIIDDSHSNFYGRLHKKSALITARNPFKKDETVLDYEMDSEDEWAEQHGEDLDKKDADEEQEDEEMANEEEEAAGFIVSDGHLSVCEYDFSDGEGDDEKKKREITLRRERLKQ